MVKLTIKCVCDVIFSTEISEARLDQVLSTTSLAALVLPHNDHFVTIYVDRNYSVRNVERVILVDEDRAPVVISESPESGQVSQILAQILKDENPNKNYNRFISVLLSKLKSPDALFVAGEEIGKRMWLEWRDPILRMGARYQTSLDLIIKSELKPILDKSGKTKLVGDQGIEVDECAAPQFVVGLAQGVLNAVSQVTEEKITVKFAYQILEDSVSLSILV
ncbi:MAG: hypothetical protein ACFFED_07525 [Candidatus Thorarchaeota archaeon]